MSQPGQASHSLMFCHCFLFFFSLSLLPSLPSWSLKIHFFFNYLRARSLCLIAFHTPPWQGRARSYELGTQPRSPGRRQDSNDLAHHHCLPGSSESGGRSQSCIANLSPRGWEAGILTWCFNYQAYHPLHLVLLSYFTGQCQSGSTNDRFY